MKKEVAILITVIVVVAVIGVVALSYPHSPTNYSTYSSTQYSTTIQSHKQVLEPYPITPCAPFYIGFRGQIVSSMGLTLYNLSDSNSSGISDYVIAPGDTGTINYILHVSSYGVNETVLINNTGFTELYNATTSNVELINVSSASGINISYHPYGEMITSNNVPGNALIPINMSIATASNAPYGSYWLFPSPGQCWGWSVPILLTVGNTPFNGSIYYPGTA